MRNNADRNLDQEDPTMSKDTYAIIGTVLAVGLALGTMAWGVTDRLDERINRVEDRFQTSMNHFRDEVVRLAERQSRIEGQLEIGPRIADN